MLLAATAPRARTDGFLRVKNPKVTSYSPGATVVIAGAARALNTASVQAKLDAKKQQILKIKGEIESEFLKHKAAPRTLASVRLSCRAARG